MNSSWILTVVTVTVTVTVSVVKYVLKIEWSVNMASTVISAVNCQLPTVL